MTKAPERANAPGLSPPITWQEAIEVIQDSTLEVPEFLPSGERVPLVLRCILNGEPVPKSQASPTPSRDLLLALFLDDPENPSLVRRVRVPGSSPKCAEGAIAGFLNKKTGYRYVHINGRDYGEHRIKWMMAYGWSALEMDHVDHDRTNNRISNLREVSRLENTRNQTLYRNNTSGVVGVYWHSRIGKWCASTRVNGVGVHGGYFETQETAQAAAAKLRAAHGFHKNHGSLPSGTLPG